jgi:hypothetical protein
MKKLKQKKITVINDDAEEPVEVVTPKAKPARAKSIKMEIDPVDAPDDNVEILGKSQQYSLAMYIDKQMDPKLFVKFIKKVEKMVRSNVDYKLYLDYLREERGLNKCVIFHNVTSQRAEIQLHHVLSNLYTICVTVCNRLLSTNKKVSTFILSDEVIRLHLEDKIALVPLSTTVHELVHAKQMRIPKSQIYGNYQAYYEQHLAFMDDYEKALYTDNEKFLVIDRDEVSELEYKGKASSAANDIDETEAEDEPE